MKLQAFLMSLMAIMAKQSAGILLYRFLEGELEVMLVHPGGPFYKNKDIGVWSIPKGEYLDNEDPVTVAIREFEEEIGQRIPKGDFIALTPIKQKGHKTVTAWALKGTIDVSTIVSNTFQMEWPPKSGKWQEIPEVDKAQWFNIDTALLKILPTQSPLIKELLYKLKIG